MNHEPQVMSRELGALTRTQQQQIARHLSPLFKRIDLEIPAQRAVAFDVLDTMVEDVVSVAEAMK